MLSDSVNILLIEIRWIFRLIRIQIQLSFWKAMFHRSLQSATSHKKVEIYTEHLFTYVSTDYSQNWTGTFSPIRCLVYTDKVNSYSMLILAKGV